MPESTILPLVNSPELTVTTSQVIADVVRQIVNHPDRVQMRTRTDGRVIMLMLTVAPDDVGKVIGKQGRTARSLRILLSSISSKTGLHFELDIEAERT